MGGNSLKNKIQFGAVKLLQQLFVHEWCFDHPTLYELHVEVKKLAVKYVDVSQVIMDTIFRWDNEKNKSRCSTYPSVFDSHVFLVPEIVPFITEVEEVRLLEMVDEIKMFSL